jgi:hypothetical protein
MSRNELEEAKEVFIGMMDEADYHGDPDDRAIYRNIRDIFEAGALRVIADAE